VFPVRFNRLCKACSTPLNSLFCLSTQLCLHTERCYINLCLIVHLTTRYFTIFLSMPCVTQDIFPSQQHLQLTLSYLLEPQIESFSYKLTLSCLVSSTQYTNVCNPKEIYGYSSTIALKEYTGMVRQSVIHNIWRHIPDLLDAFTKLRKAIVSFNILPVVPSVFTSTYNK